jgi:hypothetical protein
MDSWWPWWKVLVSDPVFNMTSNEHLEPGSEQPGQLGIVPDHILFGVGVFSTSQNWPGRVQRLGSDPAYHPIDIRGISAY